MQDMIELHNYFKSEGYFSAPLGRYFIRESRLFFHFHLNNDLNTSVEIRANEDSLQDFLCFSLILNENSGPQGNDH